MLAVAHGPLRRSVEAVRPFALGLTAVLAASAAAVIGAAPARAQTAATAPRAYELVTPVEKGGNDILTTLRVDADGSAVAFQSFGGFAGTPANALYAFYRAERTPSGWTDSGSLTAAPASPAPGLGDAQWPSDLSDDLRTAYYSSPPSTTFDAADQNGRYDVFTVRDSKATWLTPALTLPDIDAGDSYYAGRSSDGRHVVIESDKQLMPSVSGGPKRVYDLVGGQLHLVSVPASGTPTASDDAAAFGASRTNGSTFRPSDERAISTDGSRIYYTVDGQLYVRIDGTTTKLISADSSGNPVTGADATFEAASDNGHVVFFRSLKPLNASDTDGGLYRYDADADELRQIAALDPASGHTFLVPIKTSRDGARTYFVADAALAGSAAAGDDNLYLWTTAGLRFVAKVSSTDGSYLWGQGEFDNKAALSADGRLLAFPSFASIGGANSGGRLQVYLYDSARDSLSCASCPPPGVTPSGDSSLHDIAGSQQVAPLAFANDGTLFFQSPDPLTADDTDTAFDVYAYDATGPHLLSTGTGAPVWIGGNSADGRDVFVRTGATLSSDDHDGGFADVYDLRVGGGFPQPPAPCVGEACRGPQSQPAATAAPASPTASDTSAAPAATPQRTTFEVAKISAASRAKWPRTGTLTLSVHVSDDAAVTAKASATLGKKKTTVASRTAVRAGAGTVKVPLKLSSKARSALKRSHKLTVRIAVTCTGSRTTAHATVVLHTKAARR